MSIGIFNYLPDELLSTIYKNVFDECVREIEKYPSPYARKHKIKTKDLIDFSELELHTIRCCGSCCQTSNEWINRGSPKFVALCEWPVNLPVYMRFYREFTKSCQLNKMSLQRNLEIPVFSLKNNTRFILRPVKISHNKILFVVIYIKYTVKIALSISVNYHENDKMRFKPQFWKLDNMCVIDAENDTESDVINNNECSLNLKTKIEEAIADYNCQIETSGTIFWARQIDQDVISFYCNVLDPDKPWCDEFIESMPKR